MKNTFFSYSKYKNFCVSAITDRQEACASERDFIEGQSADRAVAGSSSTKGISESVLLGLTSQPLPYCRTGTDYMNHIVRKPVFRVDLVRHKPASLATQSSYRVLNF